MSDLLGYFFTVLILIALFSGYMYFIIFIVEALFETVTLISFWTLAIANAAWIIPMSVFSGPKTNRD